MEKTQITVDMLVNELGFIPPRGRIKWLSEKTGYSRTQVGDILAGRRTFTERFKRLAFDSIRKELIELSPKLKKLFSESEVQGINWDSFRFLSDEEQSEANRLRGLLLSDPLMKEGAQILERFIGSYRYEAVLMLRKLATKAEKTGGWAPFPRIEKEE